MVIPNCRVLRVMRRVSLSLLLIEKNMRRFQLSSSHTNCVCLGWWRRARGNGMPREATLRVLLHEVITMMRMTVLVRFVLQKTHVLTLCVHTHTHTHTHVHTHTLTHTHTHTHVLTCTYTYTHTHTCSHVHTRTYRHTHTYTRTHTYTHIHTSYLVSYLRAR